MQILKARYIKYPNPKKKKKTNPKKSFTINLKKHQPNSCSDCTNYDVDKYLKLKIYGGNISKTFIKYLISESKRIYKLLKINKSIN